MVDEITNGIAILDEENGQEPVIAAATELEEGGDTSTGVTEPEPEPEPSEPKGEENGEEGPGEKEEGESESEEEPSEEEDEDKLMTRSEIDDEWDKVMTEEEKVLSALNFLHEDEYDGGMPVGQLAFKNSVEKDDIFDPRKEEDEVDGTDQEPPLEEESEVDHKD